MSDYLRARIDALQQEVNRLMSKVDVLEAKLEVSQDVMLNEKYQEL